MKRLFSRAAVALTVASACPTVHAANYYFSAGASGGNGTQGSPWGSLSFLNNGSFQPGDKLLLTGSFSGSISLGAGHAGVTIQGNGARATINAGDASGITATNVGGVTLSNLNVFGSGPVDPLGGTQFTNTGDGIRFVNGVGRKQDVTISNVQVGGFGKRGIRFESGDGTTGFNNVNISNAVVFDNQVAGVSFEGDYNNGGKSNFTNVTIDRVQAFRNRGRANEPEQGNTGSGIVIGQVNGGRIQNSLAWQNGTNCASTKGGGVGIWAWDSNDVKIQYNESYENGTAGTHDGGGFDLDGGVTNSVMQYNYSHDNTGAGFLLAQFNEAEDAGKHFSGNTVRFNISEDDGRKNGYGGIHAFGRIRDTKVYNNTIFMSPAAKPTSDELNASPHPTSRNEPSAAVRLRGSQDKEIGFFNNLFMLKSNEAATEFEPVWLGNLGGADGFSFLNNAYWDFDSNSFIGIGSDGKAYKVNPKLKAAGQGGELGPDGDLHDLAAYLLQDGSPLIDKGLDLAALYGIDMGAFDFYGVPKAGSGWDIGASENPNAVATPEPAASALLGLAALGLLRRGRRSPAAA
ncbi:MAG TPA: right-handed parallel beta-helix repeat-containing protein [Tepidisphaeraceae bacterium]|nr:right-handed parallel beta-helix repeat-containing protein [Tepidisphaeraceae bacterium]